MSLRTLSLSRVAFNSLRPRNVLGLRPPFASRNLSVLTPYTCALHHGAPRQFDRQTVFTLVQSNRYINNPVPPLVEANQADCLARVMKVCRAFDKISEDKLTSESHFMSELGLDSLDHVELIMAIEDEFGMEIPDTVAEKLLRPTDVAMHVFTELKNKPKPFS